MDIVYTRLCHRVAGYVFEKIYRFVTREIYTRNNNNNNNENDKIYNMIYLAHTGTIIL